MIRAYKNNERIATAVTLKDNTVLQVYPEKKSFATMDEWKATFTDTSFVEGELSNVSPEKAAERALKRDMDKITKHLSYPKDNDTPMQKTVRQLYFQLCLRDSCNKYYHPDSPNIYYRTRMESGLSVMIPNEGLITPVYFNYTSGQVYFNNQNQTNTSLLGLTFYYSYNKIMRTITPIVQNPVPNQKTIIWGPCYWLNYKSQENILQKLMDAGFYILFYNTYLRWGIVEKLYKIPNVKGVLSLNSGNDVNVFSPPRAGDHHWHFQSSVNVNTFIANKS